MVKAKTRTPTVSNPPVWPVLVLRDLHRVALIVVFIAVFSLDMILFCPNIFKSLLTTRYNSTISYNLKPFVASNRVGGAVMRVPSNGWQKPLWF